ncbi:MAG: DinB family protein [Blastocatellia bacterium]|nr:MAG: DinB family protein [Blastocatellia bacterium]
MSSTSKTQNLREVEVFRHQNQVTNTVVHVNLADITHDESLVRPSPAGNCLNWVLGHLSCIYNNVLPLLGESPVPEQEALRRYDRGSAPITSPADAMKISDLIRVWDESVKRLDAGLAKLTSEKLDQRVPNSPTNNPNETVRSLLSTIAFHQAYHAGQLGVLRRIAGRPGAIA